MQTTNARIAFSIEEVAAAVGVTPGVVRGWLRRGDLIAARVGRRRLILVQDLERALGTRINEATHAD